MQKQEEIKWIVVLIQCNTVTKYFSHPKVESKEGSDNDCL